MRQPKKYITPIKYRNNAYGNERRINYNKEIFRKQTEFPKPLEYEDIDKAMFEFTEKEVSIVADGELAPTFKLYSNQRFSEYSQNWKHTDNKGNLLLNFKTISRDNNPKTGDNQGGLWNIPGNRYYTMSIRTVLDDNGTEHYEIYSMKQPYSVDLMYRINFVTDKMSLLNEFNIKLNDLFKSRQCYIRPNGHFIPMVIDSINDESTYTIDDRKFFTQSFVVKVMAYIINKDDFKVEKKPKRVVMFMEGDSARPKPLVNIEEYDDVYANKTLDLTINFEEYHDKVEFTIDTDMVIEKIDSQNIRKIRLWVNGTPYFIDKGFSVKNGDKILVKIRQYDANDKSSIIFTGYDPNNMYQKNNVPENVGEEETKSESITVE